MYLRALASIAALALVSCSSVQSNLPSSITPYRIEIQQGNFVSQEMVSQLKIGMSKDQVRFVLGTPLITDSFHSDRWDYVFRRQSANRRDVEHRRVAVFFEDGKLKRIEGDITPAAGADAAPVKLPDATPATPPTAVPDTPVQAKPLAQTASEAPKPGSVPASAPVPVPDTVPAPVPVSIQTPTADKPEAAPEEQKPQEKSWFEKLKEKMKF